MGTSHTQSSRASTYTTIFVQKCYKTHVFCGLLAHEFSSCRMKNGTPDLCAGCFVSLTRRAHSKCHCLKSEVAPIGFSHFPHCPGERGKAFVPGEAIVSNTSIRSLSRRCWSSCSLRSSSVVETPPSCRRSHDSLSPSLSRRGSGVEELSCVALR